MQPGGSVPHSQGISNNFLSWAEFIQIPVLTHFSLGSILVSSHLLLGQPRGLFPLDLPVRIFTIVYSE